MEILTNQLLQQNFNFASWLIGHKFSLGKLEKHFRLSRRTREFMTSSLNSTAHTDKRKPRGMVFIVLAATTKTDDFVLF
jgi:hypothetical protein